MKFFKEKIIISSVTEKQDFEKEQLKYDQTYYKNNNNNNNDKKNFLNGKDEDDFLYFFYSSLNSFSVTDEMIIFSLKNLKRVLADIINFQIINYTVSPANFIPLPAYCMDLMPKQIQEILLESRWK